MAVNLTYHQSAFRLDEEMKLVERAKEHPRYFAPLYERYHEAIFRYVYKRVDEIENAYDIGAAKEGYISEDKIRRMEVEFLVDTGAAMVCLPISSILAMGLKPRHILK